MSYSINESQLSNEIFCYLNTSLEANPAQPSYNKGLSAQHQVSGFDWDTYINNFINAIKSIDPNSQKTVYKSCFIHTPKEVKVIKDDNIDDTIKEYLQQTDLFYHYNTGNKKHPQLHIFASKCMFASTCMIEKFLKQYHLAAGFRVSANSQKGSCTDCKFDCGATVITSAGKNNSFHKFSPSDLLKKTTDTLTPLLKSFRPNYIEYMLDLQNDHICRLLPYLLTAYVYNYKKNSFIRHGTTGPDLAFGSEPSNSEGTDNIPRVKKQLQLLSKRFFLPDKPLSWIEDMPGNDDTRLWDPNQSPAPWASLPLLWRVFVAWCGALLRDETSFIDEAVCAKIDFELCLELFSSHTGFTPSYVDCDARSF